ncbi:MAG: hypothetical protein Q6373_022050, partial [Candidatus Sigynarchaeota archaeon]
MMLTEFPIQDPLLRTPLLALEWYFTFLCFEVGFFFSLRYTREKEKVLRNLQNLGYSAILIGFSLMWLFFIFSDYFSSDAITTPFFIWKFGSVRTIFLNIGYSSLIIGALFCTYF